MFAFGIIKHILALNLGLSSAKDPRRKTLAKELEEEEITLRQSVEKLKLIEESRTSLVKHLREALREQVKVFHFCKLNNLFRHFDFLLSFVCQESELENLQSQIQVIIDFCYLCLGVSNPNSDRFNPLTSENYLAI